MTRDAFERLVVEGALRILPRFRRHLADVAIVVEDIPSRAQWAAAGVRKGSLLCGLYEGTPRTERPYLPYHYPDKITLFQRTFERLCAGDGDCIREEVAHTVWHELGHALGFSERRIRALEEKRRR